jgi:hypothetical protein
MLDELTELDRDDTHAGVSSESSEPLFNYEMNSDPDDTTFAIFCPLKDATKVRLFVRRTWRQCKAGRVSKETASAVMNAGISMIELLSQMFYNAHPSLMTDMNIMRHLEEHRFTPEDHQDAYDDGIQEYDLRDLCCQHTTDLVHHFIMPYLHADCKPQDFFGHMKTEEIFSVKTMIQLITLDSHSDEKLAFDSQILPQDGLLKQLAIMKKIRLPPAAIFAFQMFRITVQEFGQNRQDVVLQARSAIDNIAATFADQAKSDQAKSEAIRSFGLTHSECREASEMFTAY